MHGTQANLPKLCPRCGAFYQDLPSKTCPQCFAKLDVLDPKIAEALAVEQTDRAGDPESTLFKKLDDDRFARQAFAGCLGMGAIASITTVIAIFMVLHAMHHARPTAPPTPFDNVATTLPQHVRAFSRLSYDRVQPPGASFPILEGAYTRSLRIYAAPLTLSQPQRESYRFALALQQRDAGPSTVTVEQYSRDADYVILAPSLAEANEAAQALAR